MNTQQFTATSSMEDQKYRARAGQLFVDNFGRLNMTVQTGSSCCCWNLDTRFNRTFE